MNTQRIVSTRKYLGLSECLLVLLLASSPLWAAAGKIPDGFTKQVAELNGVKLHYLIGGKGSPVVLLHGYTEPLWSVCG